MDCGLKCSYNIIGKTDNCKFKVPKDDDGWIPVEHKKNCIDCKEAAKHLYCNEIEKEIPLEFLSGESLPIALLGARASGKSNYIGVLINEIKKKMTGPFNCSLSMASSQESKQAYNELYYRPLYESGYTVKATDYGEVPPLIFPLRFTNAKNKVVSTVALTFYDTAGENLDDEKAMHVFNRYITNAKGIILLLDPLQVPKIRDLLSKNGFTALPKQKSEIYNVLSTIISVIRNVRNIKEQIHIPLALVFTKIDVLEQYNLLPENSCLKEESEHIKHGAFIRSDFENTNIEMQALIDNWIDGELLSYIKQFKRYSFFGVSSLGGNPINDGTRIDSHGIRPRRVLDPFLWLLNENGYFSVFKRIRKKLIFGLAVFVFLCTGIVCSLKIKHRYDQVMAYKNSGIAYFDTGDYDSAIKEYTEAIRLRHGYAEIYRDRGNAYNRRGDYDSAIVDYTKAIRLKLNDMQVYNSRGDAYMSKGDYDQAIDDYTKTIQLEFHDARIYGNRGQAYYNKQDYDRAIMDYSKVLQLKPDDTLVYYNRGQAYYNKQDYAQAIIDYESVLRLDPKNEGAKKNLEAARKRLPQKIQPQKSSNSAIPGKFPQASQRLLTVSDLRNLDKNSLRIMRNEIFARHGYVFQTDDMKAYFRNQSWYVPKYDNVSSMLTTIEKKNIEMIRSYE